MTVRLQIDLQRSVKGERLINAVREASQGKGHRFVSERSSRGDARLVGQAAWSGHEQFVVSPKKEPTSLRPERTYRRRIYVIAHQWPGAIHPVRDVNDVTAAGQALVKRIEQALSRG